MLSFFHFTMGRENVIIDPKSHLVMEICDLSIGCAHKPPFVDWYLVLQVEENAGLEIMRKQYHKLALQLHPDKNKHPKAEVAFKFLSEAYSCLSNNARRVKFNLERKSSKCLECNNIENAPKIIRTFPNERLISSPKVVRKSNTLRARFLEESKVVRNCLKAISESKSRNLPKDDYPVFNPVDYLFQGYPHTRMNICKNSENLHYLWKNNVLNCRRL